MASLRKFPFIHRRPSLASSIANGLEGGGLSDFRSGLFLTAPRRTGKTTFLKEDLIPECVSRDWYPVYVDFWSDRDTDPAELINTAIADEIAKNESLITKMSKGASIQKLSILKTASWDFSKPKLSKEVTLSKALELLHVVTGKLIILVIDEAQHALNSDSGINAMFGLKAARDHLIQGQDIEGLRLVFTGSSRDKLAQLVLKKNQPFFGSSVTTFPLLDEDYVQSFTKWVNEKLADGNQFSTTDMAFAFEMVGQRPELLLNIISTASLSIGDAPNLRTILTDGAINIRHGMWSEYESSYNALTDIQKALLEVISNKVSNNAQFSAYAQSTIHEVSVVLKSLGSKTRSNAASIQVAIKALGAKGLLWKSSRGNYVLEDRGFVEWFKMR
ncbi:hypothetical protein [Marinomonas transparens]|uniref:Archaeal ATPase n=1 Tax=Marinomonas transparens TaxID=2795388 RepID=A0A934JP90_9GAMM|nr:hypothetical protein [Marinomonas transparens]MBJ7539925.1 hypothetical protein [Marinomonas transparens]